jgi:hypothetical protein
MANRDVLDIAEQYISKSGTWTLNGGNTNSLVGALAAEVRELRKDKARLDWVLNDDFARYDPRQKEYIGLIEDREDIDAAMAGEG